MATDRGKDRVRKQRNRRGRSAAPEGIVRGFSDERLRDISRSTVVFYDNMSEEERADDRAWAAFSVARWAQRK